MRLKGSHIYLRALEPNDLALLSRVENNEAVWEISNTVAPYASFLLKEYLANAHKDIYEVKQLRLVIVANTTNQAIGFVDLFDFEPKHKRVGVGILIASENEQSKGHGSEALQLVCGYAFEHLLVHQLYANITEDNLPSIRVFEKLGFERCACKKDWIATSNGYKNELSYQLLKAD